MRYKFGVMSSLYELESESLRTAKLSMVLFLKTSCPIAIYNLSAHGFNPTEFLTEESGKTAPKDLQKVMSSIVKCDVDHENTGVKNG